MKYLCPTGTESLNIGGASYSPVTLSNGVRVFDLPDGNDYGALLQGWTPYHSVYPNPVAIEDIPALSLAINIESSAETIPVADPRDNNPVDPFADETSHVDGNQPAADPLGDGVPPADPLADGDSGKGKKK